MELDLATATARAQAFFGTSQALTRLGWGVSGYVFLSPDLRTAVKIHRQQAGYLQELATYQRLTRLKISQLLGLTIPKLRGFRHDLLAIQMDFVSPPFLLDFAGARFSPPDFSDEVLADWHQRLEEMFGANVSVAHNVYYALSRHGIYYIDLRPSNLKIEGLPDVLPESPPPDVTSS